MSNNKAVIQTKCTNCGNTVSELEITCPCGYVYIRVQADDIDSGGLFKERYIYF